MSHAVLWSWCAAAFAAREPPSAAATPRESYAAVSKITTSRESYAAVSKFSTPEQLRNLRPGDCAFVAPPRSKPDQWGEIHCSFPVVYVFTYDADNAAAAS